MFNLPTNKIHGRTENQRTTKTDKGTDTTRDMEDEMHTYRVIPRFKGLYLGLTRTKCTFIVC